MQAIELPAELTVRFNASVRHKPEDRAFTREWLASAMEGVPVEVVEGFTTIEPLPKRIEPKGRRKKKASGDRTNYVRAHIETDYAVSVVGSNVAIGRALGLSDNTVSRWPAIVPSRYEMKVRELLRNWKYIARARNLFASGLTPSQVARQLDIPQEQLFDICQRFNVNTNE